jgi:hypothetical protein
MPPIANSVIEELGRMTDRVQEGLRLCAGVAAGTGGA